MEKLIISNLNFEVRKNDLWDFVERITGENSVIDIKLPPNAKNEFLNRGFAFVTFHNRKLAEVGFEKIEGSEMMQRRLRVDYALRDRDRGSEVLVKGTTRRREGEGELCCVRVLGLPVDLRNDGRNSVTKAFEAFLREVGVEFEQVNKENVYGGFTQNGVVCSDAMFGVKVKGKGKGGEVVEEEGKVDLSSSLRRRVGEEERDRGNGREKREGRPAEQKLHKWMKKEDSERLAKEIDELLMTSSDEEEEEEEEKPVKLADSREKE